MGLGGTDFKAAWSLAKQKRKEESFLAGTAASVSKVATMRAQVGDGRGCDVGHTIFPDKQTTSL